MYSCAWCKPFQTESTGFRNSWAIKSTRRFCSLNFSSSLTSLDEFYEWFSISCGLLNILRLLASIRVSLFNFLFPETAIFSKVNCELIWIPWSPYLMVSIGLPSGWSNISTLFDSLSLLFFEFCCSVEFFCLG